MREAAGAKPLRRRQARGAGADDDDVEFVMRQFALLGLAGLLSRKSRSGEATALIATRAARR
jgi:hypothetical protein